MSFNGGGWGLVASTVFKTVATSRREVRWVRFPHALAILALVCASGLAAQTPVRRGVSSDTVAALRDTLADTLADTLKGPPIAPRRAMLLSLLLPGYSQSRLNRPTSSVLFAAAEVLSIGMARKAAQDLREARAARADSIPTGFTIGANGTLVATGFVQNRLVARVGARKTHYEDWIAAIIFNHVISAADAYVAANLWDFRANVSLGPGARSANLGGSVTF